MIERLVQEKRERDQSKGAAGPARASTSGHESSGAGHSSGAGYKGRASACGPESSGASMLDFHGAGSPDSLENERSARAFSPGNLSPGPGSRRPPTGASPSKRPASAPRQRLGTSSARDSFSSDAIHSSDAISMGSLGVTARGTLAPPPQAT